MPRKQSAKFRIDEPIRYEELLDSSSMSGLVSFLDLPTHSIGIPNDRSLTVGIPTTPSSGIPDKRTPATGIPEEVTITLGIPRETNIGIPHDSEASSGIPIGPTLGPGKTVWAQTPSATSTIVHSIPDSQASSRTASLTSGPSASTTPAGTTVEATATPGIPNVRYAHIIEARRLRPFRLTLVQDGHSRNEQAIYEVLWKDGQQLTGVAAKSVQIGYGELARRARVSRNSVIRLLLSLEKKFSISRKNTEATQAGSWYTVLDYSSILEARQRAGLLWAVKDRNGVLLLTRADVVTPHFRSLGIPDEAPPGIPIEPLSGIPSSPPHTLVMPINSMPGIPTEPLPGIPNNGSYHKYLRQGFRKDDDVANLMAEIKQQTDGPPWDRAAAQRLWNSCREQGVKTVSELMYFFNLKWQMIRLKRNTVNPVGLMTKAVPESISSEALTNLREEIDREDENSETDLKFNGWQDRYQAVLDDPRASEQEKRVAATALSQNKDQGRGRRAYE